MFFKFKTVINMELVAEISKSKKAAKTENITKYQSSKSVDNKHFSPKFLDDLRASIADAEDPETAFNDILAALKEVELAKENGVKLQSAREFMSKF
jgi:hypothetical protein